ncbi:F-box/FBD/LRR-repeat protein At1g13570-like [Rutidosis leptorrhynchoides]|uniref:F-box/FBD/LRR-repeat protein At1g13570-like n=1 Tax=Rutidosis leptorrhynchoides TaxID=125765 RepID=UPI003A99C213
MPGFFGIGLQDHLAEMEPSSFSSDIISGLPQNIIETILCLVPIRDAVRTSILAKKWRNSWNKIPKLVFNEDDMFDNSEEKSVLLLHEGSILEFSLSMNADDNCIEIGQIITYLSRKNTVKKLTLAFDGDSTYDLPRLTSFFLNSIQTPEEEVIDFVSKSPLLKSFSMKHSWWFTCDSMWKLLAYIPAIEYLYLFSVALRFDDDESCLPELPTPLVHLKYAHLVDEYLTSSEGLPFVVFLIKNSPNLEKLKLESSCFFPGISGIDPLTVKEYSDIWLKHLKELELSFVANKMPNLEVLKLIMARSPMLKEVNILIGYEIDKDEETEMLRVLSDTQRASGMVKINVERLAAPESSTEDDEDPESSTDNEDPESSTDDEYFDIYEDDDLLKYHLYLGGN